MATSHLRPRLWAVGLALCSFSMLPSQAAERALHLADDWVAARLNDPTYLAVRSQADMEVVQAQAGGMAFLPQMRLSSAQLESDQGGRRDSLSVVQPLLNVDRIAGWREQEPRQALAQARLAQGEMELAQRLFAAYVDGLRSQDAMSRNQMRLSALEDQLRAVRRLFELEQGTLTDIRDAELKVLQARAETVRLTAERDAARLSYQSMTGRPLPEVTVREGGDTVERWRQVVLQMVNELQDVGRVAADSPVSRLARYQYALAGVQADRARYAWVPEVSASHTVSRLNGVTNRFTGLSLSMPLEANDVFGARMAGAQEAQAAAAMHDAERQVRLQASRLLSDVQSGVMRLELAQSAVDTARLGVEANEKSFKGGVRSVVDVLNSIDQLYLAQSTRTEAQLSLAAHVLDLLLLDARPADLSLSQMEQLLLP